MTEKDETTSTDDEQGEEQALTQLNADSRQEQMEAIAARNYRDREASMGLTQAAPAQAPEDEKPDPLQEQLSAQMGDELITDPGGRRVRIKVEGEERDISLEEVLREFQKGSAADRRLKEATKLLDEAKQQTERNKGQAAPDTGSEAPERSPVQSPDDVESQITEALSAIYEGNHDAAKEALARAIRNSTGGQKPTQELTEAEYSAITSRVQQKVQQQLEVDTAFARIQETYPKVISSPDIELLAAIKINDKMAAGKTRPAAMLEAAEEVYTSLGFEPVTAGRKTEGQGESRDEKLMRKATRDRIPAASAAAPSAPDNRTPVPVSSTIAKIAAGRMGQSLPA
jgi:hypothetical protein